MSKQTTITRYLLILKKLQRGPASFADILFSLQTEGEIRGASYTTDLRTFQRDLREIESLFGVRITFCRKTKAYHITERAVERQQALRLLESYEMLDALHATEGYAEHVFFETRRPGGLEHFSPLLGAIKASNAVRIVYQKFGDNPRPRVLNPLALKEARSRWYLVAEDPADGIIKTFGLDRIVEVTPTSKRFKKPEGLDLNAQFENFFGVLTPPNAPLERILLQFTAFQGQYLKTYPLHHSQRVLEETGERVILELSLSITLDFVMELLSFGTSLTVLSPLSLVEDVARAHQQAFQNHQQSLRKAVSKAAAKPKHHLPGLRLPPRPSGL